MGITYTQNLHLGLQEDKRDYLNWDVITQNWKTIDSTVGGGTASVGKMAVQLKESTEAGYFDTLEVPQQLREQAMLAMSKAANEEKEDDDNGDFENRSER